MMLEAAPILVPALSFATVAALVFMLGRYWIIQLETHRRLSATTASDLGDGRSSRVLHALVGRYFDDKRFRSNDAHREKLRRRLLDAGYFNAEAATYYFFARVTCALGFAILIGIAQSFLPSTPTAARVLLVVLALLIGMATPDVYLARRRRFLSRRYRQVFPNFLDLLVVCIDAGLSLQAAFERVANQVSKQCRELGTHLDIMRAEIRAGRSIVEALDAFADRLHLDEAGSLVAMLRQSIELGSDVGDALRVFGDEMREKRLLRAEETANKLSVKMVIPLGLFIFPVVLLVTILPVVIKLLKVMGGG
jgi:tight adherence protein C